MKKIIVFGATGNVGSWASIFFKEKGCDVTAVGHRLSDNGFFKEIGIQYIPIDICKTSDFSILPVEKYDAVFHFAGAMPAKMKGYYPTRYIDSIINGTINILEWMKGIGCNRIVFSQSISDVLYLFGSKDKIKPDVERRNPLVGDHAMYSIAKNSAVNIIEHYAAENGFYRYILRFPTIYQYTETPYYYVNGEKRWLAYRLLIDKAQKGEDIEIWGNPQNEKEIVYIKDLLQILYGCLDSKYPGGIYNVGTGVGVSLEDQIKGIIEVFSPKGKRSNVIYKPDMPSSPQFILDIEKTKNELNYVPQYDYLSYLNDLKKEMEINRFAKLWGK